MIETVKIARLPHAVRKRIRAHMIRFAREEDGVMLALVVFILLIMFFTAGFGVDVMRTEMERTRIQQTIDASTLAAAHKDNTLDPKSVVLDYFKKAKLASYITSNDITVSGTGMAKSVTVRLMAHVQTPFIKPLGFDTFTVPAQGRAEQSMGNAEVSLVLDISGSMDNNSKMTRLHSAAGQFIDTVMPPEAKDRVSVSLVPYTADVNVGWNIFSRLNVRQLHNYSYCIQFLPSDFSKTSVSPDEPYLHGQYFSAFDSNFSYISCPTNDYEQVTPFSQNATKLKEQINKLRGREQTSIHIGMKWAAALLDPAFRPVTNSLIDGGYVDEAFRDRPADFHGQTTKVAVIMTDGYNTDSYKIRDFAYDTPDMRDHWARHAISDWKSKIDGNLEDSIYGVAYSGGQGDTLLANICKAAKDNQIIIYTIGFEIDNTSASKMEACASSPSHFYRVDGIQIAQAFGSIARQLKQLRLTL